MRTTPQPQSRPTARLDLRQLSSVTPCCFMRFFQRQAMRCSKSLRLLGSLEAGGKQAGSEGARAAA